MMDATQPTILLCDWCNINPAQRPNGECDVCWRLPGHEGEGEPTLAEEAYRQRFEALETFVRKVANTDPDAYTTYIDPDFVDLITEARKLLKGDN